MGSVMRCSDTLSAVDLFIALLFRDVARVMLRRVASIAISDLPDLILACTGVWGVAETSDARKVEPSILSATPG